MISRNSYSVCNQIWLIKKKREYLKLFVKKGSGLIFINGIKIHLIPEICALAPELQRIQTCKMFCAIVNCHDYFFTHAGGGLGSCFQSIPKLLLRDIWEKSQKKPQIKARIKLINNFWKTTDARRVQPKKYGGRGARTKRQKSYR